MNRNQKINAMDTDKARAMQASSALTVLTAVCNRPFQTRGFAYSRGMAVDLSAIGNVQRLLQSGHVVMTTADKIVPGLVPKKLPDPVPNPPPIQVIEVNRHSDPVGSFLESQQKTQEANPGHPRWRIRDALINNRNMSEVFLRAQRVASEDESRRMNLSGTIQDWASPLCSQHEQGRAVFLSLSVSVSRTRSKAERLRERCVSRTIRRYN